MATALCLIALALSAFAPQLPRTAVPTGERVTVSSGVTPETASPGDVVTLSVRITPRRDIRLFAPGAKDFTPVVLLVTVPRGISLGRPKYPIPERQSVPGTNKKVPVYTDSVEIEQPITISKNAKWGETLTIDGLVTYQPCDDTVTYRRATVRVTFTVRIQ